METGGGGTHWNLSNGEYRIMKHEKKPSRNERKKSENPEDEDRRSDYEFVSEMLYTYGFPETKTVAELMTFIRDIEIRELLEEDSNMSERTRQILKDIIGETDEAEDEDLE